jgi:hypothetical protein
MKPMDVFLYFTERLPCGLDELEDALDAALSNVGEVSGTGTGESGSNIDITIEDEDITKGQVAALIRSALSKYSLPSSSQMVIDDEEFSVSQ